jgi:predicted nucleotide-binding protein
LCTLCGPTFDSLQPALREKLHQEIERIQKQVERIEFLEIQNQLPEVRSEAALKIPAAKSRKIFIVHGHDENAKQAVARFIYSARTAETCWKLYASCWRGLRFL